MLEGGKIPSRQPCSLLIAVAIIITYVPWSPPRENQDVWILGLLGQCLRGVIIPACCWLTLSSAVHNPI